MLHQTFEENQENKKWVMLHTLSNAKTMEQLRYMEKI